MIKYALLFVCSALPALAETPMSANEFDAYTRGKTFYYGEGAAPYGGEEYLENNRVRWSFLDGKCLDGYWYQEGGNICFLYEDSDTPQCWLFFQRPKGLFAKFQGDSGTELYELKASDKPMMCLGPEVGV